MTPGLFLAPATPRNGAYQFFETTVLDGVPRSFYQDYTDTDHGDPARIWGLTESIQTTWGHIDPGDWLLFYTETGYYQHASQVQSTEHNPELGDAILTELLNTSEEEQGRNWDNIIYLHDPVSVSISGEEVADLLGYGNNFPVRFTRVTKERLQYLHKGYVSVDEFIDHIRTNK